MRVTILQPNYLPWRGYFDFFKQSDVFVVYDDVQYTKNDWRNRNLIKAPDGAQWLTVPVDDKNRTSKYVLIKDVRVAENGWQERHLKSLEMNYAHAPYFGVIYGLMEESFNEKHALLVDLNMSLMRKFLDYLGIRCRIEYSSKLGFANCDQTDRLVAICKHLGATEYLTGDAAKGYLEQDKFENIRVLWHKYKENVYPQLWGWFISRISIVDLLMNCGTKGYDII